MQSLTDPVVCSMTAPTQHVLPSITGGNGESDEGSSPSDEAPLMTPLPMRRPSVSCGLDTDIIPEEIIQLGNSGELVVDGVTPGSNNTSSVILEAALSFKRTGAGGQVGGRRPCAPRASSFGSLNRFIGTNDNNENNHHQHRDLSEKTVPDWTPPEWTPLNVVSDAAPPEQIQVLSPTTIQ